MKGLLGKKLGMTQLFDEESGGVTPVTVIEAGPCPVVAVRTPDADGYEAVQLAWEPVADRKITKAERVFKGMKMAGRMGGKRATQVGLTVHSVDPERNLLLVKGAVPGPKNGLVEIREDAR